ncbi:MAG: hypothetical protein M1274_01305 [Actinobacteria bacterium]|nr:hypothetical protein [Actinomycetota bacterium]
MFKTKRTRIIGLALVGLLALSGGIYATTAALAGGASAYTPTTAADPTNTNWRSAMTDMMEDHMGLTEAQADAFVNQMAGYMQGAGGNFDTQKMVDQCTQNLTNGNYGPGMMGGARTPGAGPSGPNVTPPGSGSTGFGMMGGGSGYGMMGGGSTGYGMMGGWGTR